MDNGLRSALNRKEKLRAFALSTDTHHRHMSFYMNGIKGSVGANIVAAVTNALADLPDIFRENASVVMAPQLWYDYVQECTESGKRAVATEDILAYCVSRQSEYRIVGDFNMQSRISTVDAILETDKDAKGRILFIQAWGTTKSS